MRRNLKNKILKGITTAAVINFVLTSCCLDSEDLTVPLVVIGVSALWICVFYLANNNER